MNTYRVSKNVRWSVELTSILLWDQVGNVHEIQYPETAIWDFASRGYTTLEIESRLLHISRLSDSESKQLADTALDRWLSLNWLEKK